MHLKQTQVPYVWSRHSSHVSQEQTRDSHKSRADSVPKSRKPTQFPQVWSRNIYQNSSALKYVPYVCGDTCPKSRLQICTRTYCIPLVRWSGPDTILYQYLSQMSGIDPSTVSERQRCHIVLEQIQVQYHTIPVRMPTSFRGKKQAAPTWFQLSKVIIACCLMRSLSGSIQ